MKDKFTLGFGDFPACVLAAFSPYQDENSTAWAARAWLYVEQAGLASFADPVSRCRAILCAMALADLYIEFTHRAWEGVEQSELHEWSQAFHLNPLRLGQYLGPHCTIASDSDFDEIDDDTDVLRDAVQSHRETVVAALLKGFGGKPDLYMSLAELYCRVNDFNPDDEYDADTIRRHWPLDVTSSEDLDGFSRLACWVEEGCPILFERTEGLDFAPGDRGASEGDEEEYPDARGDAQSHIAPIHNPDTAPPDVQPNAALHFKDVDGIPVAAVAGGVFRFDVTPPFKFPVSDFIRRGRHISRSDFDALVSKSRSAGPDVTKQHTEQTHLTTREEYLELQVLGLELGRLWIEAGVRRFPEFAARLVDDLGGVIKPYLKGAYLFIHMSPGHENAGMDSVLYVQEMPPEDLDALIVHNVAQLRKDTDAASAVVTAAAHDVTTSINCRDLDEHKNNVAGEKDITSISEEASPKSTARSRCPACGEFVGECFDPEICQEKLDPSFSTDPYDGSAFHDPDSEYDA